MRVILFALLFVVASVSGQCTGCIGGSSGPCKNPSNSVCYAEATPGVCFQGTTLCSGGTTTTTTKPPTTGTTTKPPVTTKPAGCGNCITKQMIININKQSSYWGRCDQSQPVKPGSQADGFYCTDAYIQKLNEMLCTVGYCYNTAAKQAFIGQVTHETAYFTKFFQSLDNGRGALHMLPANMPRNVADMQALWPSSNAQSTYNSQGAAMLTTPAYAWLSAAAWFLRTNAVIPNCNKNIFLTSFSETSRCVFGNGADAGLAERQRAFNYAQTYITATSPSESSAITASPSCSLLILIGVSVFLLFQTQLS